MRADRQAAAMAGHLACVFHIHTCHSFDCVSSPSKTVMWAKRRGIRVLGITDHNTIRGAQEAARSAVGSGVQVIVGAEYATNHGDIIGLFLREEIESRDALEVIDAIKKQEGVSVLPHPYHGHSLTETLAEAVDMVEVFNARCSESQNHRAMEIATALRKPMIGGADAHFVSDLESCICYLETHPVLTPERLLRAKCAWVGKPSSRTGLYLSQVIKGAKTGDPALVKACLRAVLLSYFRNAVGDEAYTKLRTWKRQRDVRAIKAREG